MTLLKDQEDVATYREDGQIVKKPKTVIGVTHLDNEMMHLKTLEPSGYVPKIVTLRFEDLVLEDLGDGEEVTDADALLTHAIHLLAWLNKSGIIHGDLTAPNIIIRDNRPYAIDFHEAVDDLSADYIRPKRPEGDWFHLLQAMEAHGDPRRIMRRWLAIRESMGTASLQGKALVDFGCHEGYMVALAAANGANALGWDFNQIVCANARTRWAELPMSEKQFPLTFLHHNIDYFRRQHRKSHADIDVGLCLSVYPYLIQQLGEERARLILAKMVASFDMLFFEAQSSGDGPGPAFWKDQDAVGEYLSIFGAVEEVCRLRIAGRDAERVTWKVTKNV